MRRAAIVAFIVIAVAAGFRSSSQASSTRDVSIIRTAFTPETLVVQKGDTVRWTNRDNFVHSATSESYVWDSGVIEPNGTFEYTFNEVAVFSYYCQFHTNMSGEIRVTFDAPTPTPTPTPASTPTPTPSGATPTPPPTTEPTPNDGGGYPTPGPGRCWPPSDSGAIGIGSLYIAFDGMYQESNGYPGLQRHSHVCPNGTVVGPDTQVIGVG